jgi:uncharacterized repeat protein (TIGR03803 family)
MSLLRHAHAGYALGVLLLAAPIASAGADTLQALHRFANTGSSTKSQYGLGANPYGALLQAADSNYYGTTVYGGSGLCPQLFTSGTQGCGTIFRMTPQRVVTVLYSFPYDTATGTAQNDAYPTAGLIEGKDGFLYGVAQEGSIPGCNGALGCGTLFRISTAGVFTLLHQFCNGDGCANPSEGGRPMAHLVQLPSTTLCGTTQQGGIANSGTLFCASTSGAVTTEYILDGTKGYEPAAALLVGTDGTTLYGTAPFGGANGQGKVFAFKSGTVTTLHDFGSSTDTTINPERDLIFGANGKLYGATYGGSPAGGIFSLNTDGTGFSSLNVFNPEVVGAGYESRSGLELARNGLMYGTTYTGGADGDGCVYSLDPTHGTYKLLASFATSTGAAPVAALIEGSDNFLYGTTTLYGGNNARGPDQGSVIRLAPALKK